jgi:hypothetical protein
MLRCKSEDTCEYKNESNENDCRLHLRFFIHEIPLRMVDALSVS